MKTIDELKLGDTVYDASAFNESVIERKVVFEVFRRWLEEDGSIVERREVRAAGGFFGVGDVIDYSSWGNRFFDNHSEAAAAWERNVAKRKEDQRQDLEKEREQVEQRLKELDA